MGMPKSISRQVRIVLAAVLFCCGLRAESLKSFWPAAGPSSFREALEEGIGFSFTYEGQRVGPVLPGDWTATLQAWWPCAKSAFGLNSPPSNTP
jgi:hypothetical protein